MDLFEGFTLICRRYTKYSDKVEDWQQRLYVVNQSYKKAISGQMFSPAWSLSGSWEAVGGRIESRTPPVCLSQDVQIICRRPEEPLLTDSSDPSGEQTLQEVYLNQHRGGGGGSFICATCEVTERLDSPLDYVP